jgi:tRNA (guanosine-2'-O-)-methyltransferase
MSLIFAGQRNKRMSTPNWISLDIEAKREFYQALCSELTTHKQSLFAEKVKNRTRHFALGLEDMMKTQNASALMRTADAFGVHPVHIYDKNERFSISSGISKGVEKWLDAKFFNSYDQGGTSNWVQQLKATGRKLYVTALDPRARPLQSIDPAIPATVCFGNEKDGASKELQALADEIIYIPMQGFVESFNVSVSCGITLHHLTLGMESNGISRGLEPEDEINTLIQWALRTVPNPHRFF